mmetsp:Transcript_19284/g.27899  ORF Transcript_19284/g.27899 Transcript_19284/m.27899 type:complete len:108 (+) Transcript_19284:697-1020(+)
MSFRYHRLQNKFAKTQGSACVPQTESFYEMDITNLFFRDFVSNYTILSAYHRSHRHIEALKRRSLEGKKTQRIDRFFLIFGGDQIGVNRSLTYDDFTDVDRVLSQVK